MSVSMSSLTFVSCLSHNASSSLSLPYYLLNIYVASKRVYRFTDICGFLGGEDQTILRTLPTPGLQSVSKLRKV